MLVATAQNHVYSLNASTGAANWNVQLGTAVASGAPGLCGIPLNPLGITGTPVIDAATRTIYLRRDDQHRPRNGPRHMLHALALDTSGTERAGWPIDVTATATLGRHRVQLADPESARGAGVCSGGKVFVPFGGHIGDCLGYHGWIVGVTTTGTPQVSAWATTRDRGRHLGHQRHRVRRHVALRDDRQHQGDRRTAAPADPARATANWGGGEAVIKFPTTPAAAAADARPPTTSFRANWVSLDTTDADIGGTGPVLFTRPGRDARAIWSMALGQGR